MANERRTISAGYDHVFYGTLDTNSYLKGGTATAPSAGQSSGMKRLYGAKTMPVQVNDIDAQPVTGDDIVLGTFLFESAATVSGVITQAVQDMDFAALVEGTVVEDQGNFSFGALQPGSPNYEDMLMIFQKRSKTYDPDTNDIGVGGWEGVIALKANIKPLGPGGLEERTAGVTRYGIVLNPSGRKATGSVITSTGNGTTSMFMTPFTSNGPVTIHRATGDGSALAVTLDYTPISIDDVVVSVDGVYQTGGAGSDFTLSGNTITFEAGSAPASNSVIIIFYAYNV